MIGAGQVWNIIQSHVPRRQWVSSREIFAMVEMYGNLDEEDRQPRFRGSGTRRWQVLVHDVLATRLKEGRIRSRKRVD